MSDLTAIAYVSSATHPLANEELEALLSRSRTINSAVGVSGVLLYHDGSFFQYLEGPHDAVNMVYSRVMASRLHHGIEELLREPVAQLEFSDWYMGFAQTPRTTLQKLAQAQWMHALGGRPLPSGSGRSTPGVELLRSFWARARQISA